MSNAAQQNASPSKDDKVTIQNKKRYVNSIIGQEKETASEGCISDSGSVETRIQAPNSYFASSSSEELSNSDNERLQENIVHFVHTKGRQAKFAAIVNNKQSVVALFDMGATCSCINYKTFQSIMNNSEIKNAKITVVQADGQSLNPIGTVKLNVTLAKKDSCINL